MFPWTHPELPRQCVCNDTFGPECSGIGLANHRKFPPFALLPDYDDLDEDYYKEASPGSFYYTPHRHWAVVGEIVDVHFDVRHRVLLETHFGERFVVHFHLEDAASPAFFSWRDMVHGHTMCILYAKNKFLVDMSRGNRQEHSKSSMVFPANLKKLTNESQMLQYSRDTALRQCFHCHVKENEDNSFKRCARCHLALYCSKECQMRHWKWCHKKLCPHMRRLDKLISLDFTSFRGFVDWDLKVEPPPTEEDRANRHRLAVYEFLRQYGREPLSKQERLFDLLEKIKEKDTETDEISSRLYHSLSNEFLRASSEARFSGSVSSFPIFQGLQLLASKYRSNESSRDHVIDVTSTTGIDEWVGGIILDVIMFALPQWQHECGHRQILWMMEVHSYYGQDGLFPPAWELRNKDNDGFVASNQRTGDRCFFHDETQTVAHVAKAVATDFPDTLVVRVLRAYAAPARVEMIREVATEATPSNVVTLWIRESNIHGNFRPLDLSLPLRDQLINYRSNSLVEIAMARASLRDNH